MYPCHACFEFVGFRKQKYTAYYCFFGNGWYGKIPTMKKTNQNSRIYLKTTLLHNKPGLFLLQNQRSRVFCINGISQIQAFISRLPPNLEPRSPMARQKGDLVTFDFEHAYWQQGPVTGLAFIAHV